MTRHVKLAALLSLSIFLSSTTLFLQGCTKKAAGAGVAIPALAPLVKKAIPTGLKSGAYKEEDGRVTCGSGSAAAINACAAQYITNIFQNYYVSGTGTNIQGYIMNQVTMVDARSTLFSGATSTDHACLAATAQPYVFDVHALNASDTTTPNMLKFTLSQVQCTAGFTGSTGLSGEVFGVNGTNASIWVTLTDMAQDSITTGGAFINLANVANLGSTSTATPEFVDGLTVNYSPAGSQPANVSVARYKATTTTNTFEMFFTSTNSQGITGFAGPSGGGNGGAAWLTGGFRMVSDGVNIYADGTLCTDTTGITCSASGNYSAFSVCMDAVSLAVVDPSVVSNCVTVANSFTLSPNATTWTLSNLTSFSNSTTSTTTSSPDPLNYFSLTTGGTWGDIGSMSPVGTITASVVSALNAAYAVSNASAVAAAF